VLTINAKELTNRPSAGVAMSLSPSAAAPKDAIEMITRVARNPSTSIAPYPTNSASFSSLSCFALVPEATREWKPESAPQAMMRGTVGQKGEG